MTQVVNQSYADSTSSNQASSTSTASNVSTLAAAAVSTAAILQAAVLNAVMLSCVDIASKQDSDTASLNNARTNAASEDATSTQEENNSNEANKETANDKANKGSEALNKFFSDMNKLSEQETKTDDSGDVAFAPGEGPSGPSGGGNNPANVALISYLFFVFEAMKNADASTGIRMIASSNSEVVLGTNITNMVYNSWTMNTTTASININGTEYTASGNGKLGADAALFTELGNDSNLSNQSSWLSQASTQESIDSSTANTNEGTAQQQTQTWANQLSNDSQDEQGLLTTMIPDITGFGQQMAGYLGSPLPA
jgi:membrane-associated HD superfamily phosphohydrolase